MPGRDTITDPELDRLRGLLERLPTPAVYTDGDHLVFNAPAARLVGRPGAPTVSLDQAFAWLFGERAHAARLDYERARASGFADAPYTHEILHAGGEPRVVEFSVGPWEHGEIWILHDVTERHVDELARRGAETALREAEEHFRSAFENAPIGMAITTVDGRYLKVNAALCAITGYSQQRLVGWNWLDLTHPEDRDDARRRLRAGGAARSTWSSEKRYLHADGHEIWVAVSASPVRTGAGGSIGLLSLVQDITDRRRVEAHLRELADNDPLTGLLNRRRFGVELDRQHAHGRREGACGALIVFDLDGFKAVNDGRGHAAGDALLIAVADVLRARLRETDVIARLGGDEFAVLLPTSDAEGAGVVARLLVQAVRDCAASERVDVTASVGVATFDARGDELVRADLAMYAAKSAGGDGWAAADERQPTR